MRELVATRYELLDRVGRGGAADVFRARDTRLDRNVALKVLREDLTGDAEFVERFKREAKIAASLNHPNVVMVHDFGTFGDRAFIAMEYVDGVSLKEQIALSGRLDAGRAADIGSQVLSALAAAHARGLVHRDVKPQNVLLTRDGTAKLTDFGIAQGGAATGLTQAGTTVGTALYMAPEQIQGGTVGPAADIYATGVMLYEMLTGHPPFTGQSQVEVALHHLNDEPRSIGSQVDRVPPALEAAVMRALAKAPGDRFASAEDMLRALGPGGHAFDRLGATSVFATARQPRIAAAASPAALAAEAAALGESPVAAAPPAGPPSGPWWRQMQARRVAPLAAAALLALGGVAVALGGPPELRLTLRPGTLSASVDPSTVATVLSTPADPATASTVPATAAPGPGSLLLQRSDALTPSGSGSEPAPSTGSTARPPESAPARSGAPAGPPPQPSQPQSPPSPQPAPDQSAPPPPAPSQSAPAPPPRPAPAQAPAPPPQPAQATAPPPPQPTPTSAPASTQPPATGAPTASSPAAGSPTVAPSSSTTAPSPTSRPAATSAPASTPAPTTGPPPLRANASSPTPGLTPVTATP